MPTELNLSELTTEQKLGMTMTAHIYQLGSEEESEANLNYALDMIRNHALGAIWVDSNYRLDEVMQQIRDAADYPILIFTDAESGFGHKKIGRHNALACADSEESAYAFGKITAINARNAGYNAVCNPVLDMCKTNSVCGKTVRSMGSDKYRVARLAAAEARGMHDGGVLTVGKHYPSACGDGDIDPHMAESTSFETIENLLDYNLFPYLELWKEGLLDGIMTQHCRFPNIDPEYPASLSSKVISIIREQGFNGFAITDALVMMGTAAKFGAQACKGLAIGNGNDLALTWYANKESYEAIQESYKQGLIADSRLDEAVERVLQAQHKTMLLPKTASITESDLLNFDRINRDGIIKCTDANLSESIDINAKHFFVVLTPNEVEINDEGKVNVDTMAKGWYQPKEIIAKIADLFPNSKAFAISQFPSPIQNVRLLESSVNFEDVVFITFNDCAAYIGRECLTSRIVSVIQALQVTKRVSTLVHFGNPFVLEELEHIPRILIGSTSSESVSCALDVLAGKYPAKGHLTYELALK